MSRITYDRLARMVKTLWRTIPDINTKVDNILSTPTALKYQGFWDADNNLPDLSTDTYNAGDFFFVSEEGTQDLDGEGAVDYKVHDEVIFNGNSWDRKPYVNTTLESWVYKNAVYDSDVVGPSLDLKAETLPFVISDQKNFLGGTGSELDDSLSSFLFQEGDIIEIKVTFFLELNVTGNALVLQLREGTNYITDAMVDTNKQLDTNHTVVFRDVIISSSMATNGLNVVVSDIASGGTYLDMYDIYFSITKKGTNL